MKRKGFGLILVLLFTAIVLMVVSSIALSLVTDVKLNRQSKNAAAAYSMARSGLGDAIYALKSNTTEKNPIKPTKNGTTKSCDTLKGDYNYSKDGISYTKSTIATQPAGYTTSDNYYAYQLCADGTKDYIIGIGFAGGQKITLKALINPKYTYTVNYTVTTTSAPDLTGAVTTNTENKTCTGPATGCPEIGPTDADTGSVSVTWDHTKDYFKIYQAGS